MGNTQTNPKAPTIEFEVQTFGLSQWFFPRPWKSHIISFLDQRLVKIYQKYKISKNNQTLWLTNKSTPPNATMVWKVVSRLPNLKKFYLKHFAYDNNYYSYKMTLIDARKLKNIFSRQKYLQEIIFD